MNSWDGGEASVLFLPSFDCPWMPEGPLSWDNDNWGGLMGLSYSVCCSEHSLARITPAPIWLTFISSLCVRLPHFPLIPCSPANCCWQQQHRGVPYSQTGALISCCTEWECDQSTGLVDIIRFFFLKDLTVTETVRHKIAISIWLPQGGRKSIFWKDSSNNLAHLKAEIRNTLLPDNWKFRF